MDHQPKNDQWIWVLIQDPGGSEQILGQHDDDADISFIPAFLDKEQAQRCYNLLARDKGVTDEFQAIIYEELVRHATKNGFMIFLLNGSGEILEKIAP